MENNFFNLKHLLKNKYDNKNNLKIIFARKKYMINLLLKGKMK